jgi:hypothetical protein
VRGGAVGEIGDYFKAIKEEVRRDRQENRSDAMQAFFAAKKLASANGLELRRVSDVHYHLRKPGCWLINFYPGNQRIYHDKNLPKPPFLRFAPGDAITLEKMVNAAIEAEKKP